MGGDGGKSGGEDGGGCDGGRYGGGSGGLSTETVPHKVQTPISSVTAAAMTSDVKVS